MEEEMWTGGLIEALNKQQEMREENKELKSASYHLDHCIYVMADGSQVEATIAGIDPEARSTALLQVDAKDIDPERQGISLFIASRSSQPEPGKWYWLPVQLELEEMDGDEEADAIRPEVAILMRKEIREYARILEWSKEKLQNRMREAEVEEKQKIDPSRWRARPAQGKPKFSSNAEQRKKKRR